MYCTSLSNLSNMVKFFNKPRCFTQRVYNFCPMGRWQLRFQVFKGAAYINLTQRIYIYIYISSSMNICPKRYATYLFNYWNFMNKLKATRDPREWGHENHIRGTDALQYSQSWYRKGWPGPGVSKDCRTWMEMDHQWFSTELLTWMWFRMKNLMSFHIDCVCVW